MSESPPDSRQTNRIQRLLARTLGARLSGSLSKVVIRGHTGRRITVDRAFYRAQKLAERSTLALRLSPWAWQVGQELRNAPVAALSPLVFFVLGLRLGTQHPSWCVENPWKASPWASSRLTCSPETGPGIR